MRMLKMFLGLVLFAGLAGPLHADSFRPYGRQAFEAALASGQPVLVHVHAEWCGYCKRQQPVLDRLAASDRLKNVAAFRVDYDTDRDFLRRFAVNGQATVLVFKDGKETVRSAFVVDPKSLQSEILAGL